LESILPYVKAGSHVLDVGTGAGMFAAMLYHRTGKDGVTVTLSPIAEVVDLAKQNLIADGLDQVLQKGRILLIKDDETSGTMTLLLMCSNVIKLGSGYAPCSPYDVIHVSKVMEKIPPQLLTQLASPGRMVIPIRTDRHNAMIVDKDAAGNVSQRAIRLAVRI
jgi:protein-L-isoaspartate(D-aspartate) O-methyltransferase